MSIPFPAVAGVNGQDTNAGEKILDTWRLRKYRINNIIYIRINSFYEFIKELECA